MCTFDVSGKPLWYDGIIERGLAMTIPLSAAIIAGILYGAIRSVALTKNEDFEYDNIFVTLETVKDAFIWLLNAFGAEIKVCEEHEKIPMICNWTCPGFEDVGYGCFYA